MARTLSDLIAHAEAMADDFERNPPDPSRTKDAGPLRAVAAAARVRAAAEQEVADAVAGDVRPPAHRSIVLGPRPEPTERAGTPSA